MTATKSAAARWLTGGPAAALLLAAFWVLMLASLREKSVTTDEIVHLTAGYSYWRFNDYRLNPENGNLPQRVMALPLLAGSYRFPPRETEAWRTSAEWAVADSWFHQLGNDVAAMLGRGRAASGLLAVALGALVWGWSRRLFGPWGGMLSLLLFILNPSILANGALMTSDTACALFFLAATGALWRLLHRVSPGRVLASAGLIGCLFVAKMSAILFVPIAGILLLARLATGRPLPLRCGPVRRDVTGRVGQAMILTGVAALHLLIVAAVIWASYGFRYSAFPAGQPGRDHLRDPWEMVLGIPEPAALLESLDLAPEQRAAARQIFLDAGVRSNDWSPSATAALAEVRRSVLDPAQGARLDVTRATPRALAPRVLNFIRRHRLLPEAYVYGYATTWKYSQYRGAFLNGQFSLYGWPAFFPYTFLVKTPLPVFGLMLVAAAAGLARWRETRRYPGSAKGAAYETWPLATLWAVYWAAVIPSHVDIGHRHILATYPPLFILCGVAGPWAAGAPTRFLRLALASLLGLLAAEMAFRYPNYLAYFNPVDGGPAQAYRHLVDSSLDWGQDLPGVRRYVEAHPETGQAYLAYAGSGSPGYYGIAARPLYPRTQPMMALSFPAAREEPMRDDIVRRNPDYEIAAAGVRDGIETVALLKKASALRLEPGTYFVSATLLQPVEYNAPGPWGPWNAAYEAIYQGLVARSRPLLGDDPAERRAALRSGSLDEWGKTLNDLDTYRFARLTAYLRQQEPSDSVNFSILVYHLTATDLTRALEGPSPSGKVITPVGLTP
jgi:hypothetical protein